MSRKVTTLQVTEKTVCETNADQNRTPIDRIIIHTEVGTNASADHRFNDCTSKVSAHYGIGLDGSIWHWVDEDWVAFHAGDYPMNQRSIGIEHEDNGNYNDSVRTDSEYVSSAELVADICKFYNIPCDRQHILKHSEVIATGCPDGLDVERIVNAAYKILNPQSTPTIDDNTIIDLTGLVTELTKLNQESYGKITVGNLKSKLIAKDLDIVQLTGDLNDCKKASVAPPDASTASPTPPTTTVTPETRISPDGTVIEPAPANVIDESYFSTLLGEVLALGKAILEAFSKIFRKNDKTK